MAWWNPATWFNASDAPHDHVLKMASNEELFFPLNFGKGFLRYGLNSVHDIRVAFARCSPLSAIVNQKGYAFTKGTVEVWNPANGKPVRGEFKEWQALLNQPNYLQSGDQFFLQAYRYQQQYGYCVIDPTYPIGFSDRPSSMRVLPNWAVDLDWYGVGYMQRPRAAHFNWNGHRDELDVSRLIIIRDSGSLEIDETTGLPHSRFYCLEQEISNLIAGLNARGELITDRGAQGILSNQAKDVNGHIPMDPDEKDRVQSLYKHRYGLTTGKDKVIVTDAGLNWQPMTFNSDQLGLQPEHIACVKALCNIAGFPFTALAEGFEGKYNNSSDGRRDFQDRTVEPESNDFFEQLSLQLGMYAQRCEAYIDYSGVASVQASQEEKGKGLQSMNVGLETAWNNNLITRNMWLDKLGEPRPERADILALFDKYKWELTPEELGAIATPAVEEDLQNSSE